MPIDGTLYLIGIAFLATLAILWFFLPFAVFGTQPKLSELLTEVKRTNQLLVDLRSDLAKAQPKEPPIFRDK